MIVQDGHHSTDWKRGMGASVTGARAGLVALALGAARARRLPDPARHHSG